MRHRRCDHRWRGRTASKLCRYLRSDIGRRLCRRCARPAEIPVPDPSLNSSINRLRDTRRGSITAPSPVPRPRARRRHSGARRGADRCGRIRALDWCCGRTRRGHRRGVRAGRGRRLSGCARRRSALILRYRRLILRRCSACVLLLGDRPVGAGAVHPDRHVQVRRRRLTRRRSRGSYRGIGAGAGCRRRGSSRSCRDGADRLRDGSVIPWAADPDVDVHVAWCDLRRHGGRRRRCRRCRRHRCRCDRGRRGRGACGVSVCTRGRCEAERQSRERSGGRADA